MLPSPRTHIVNLGILAHVDAGKTTLTERLLYATGVIDTIGSVDRGSTQTDSLPLEQQRGITIKSAVTSFITGDITVNLIDTPGHPDFIAEVERVLGVLDGIVLVISAVEGVQAQTRVLMHALQRLHIPTLLFVNKIDRGGAGYDRILDSIADRLTPAIIPMGSVTGLGTRNARFQSFGATDERFVSSLVDLLADHDPDFLDRYLEDETGVSYQELYSRLAALTRRALVHPVFFGSAITGCGIEPLLIAIEDLLPGAGGNPEGPVSGTVFKVDRGPGGEKIAYVRIFSGTVRTRDRLYFGHGCEEKVTAIQVFQGGSATQNPTLAAGQIGKLWGLGDARIGDAIGPSSEPPQNRVTGLGHGAYFAPPSLESVVTPCRKSDMHALHLALTQLAEADPLINLRQDDLRQELYVSLYGEVQKEVIQATLAADFGIGVGFRETSPICIERPTGIGEAGETIGKAGNPFLATLALRVEPAPIDSGLGLRLDVDVKSIPLYVYNAVEEFQSSLEDALRDALQQGLCGWTVTDCLVTVTQCGYVAPATGARDFRLLTPLVVMAALQKAGTTVCEPVHRFHLEIPSDTYGAVVPLLSRVGAVLQSSTMRTSSYLLEGEILAARVHDLQQRVPAATRGEGVLECSFHAYQPVSGAIPTRPRSDYNPLNRKEYLLHVARRV